MEKLWGNMFEISDVIMYDMGRYFCIVKNFVGEDIVEIYV